MIADEAVITEFLELYSPDAIQLLAIPAEGGALDSMYFGSDSQAATKWAARQNNRSRNIYWAVNRVRPGLNKKATKAEIDSVRFAHVDIDPPKDGSKFAKDVIARKLSSRNPVPSLVIDSGGGLQAFWAVSGEATNDEIEAINGAIMMEYGGDQCGNVDRIMRVPGTVNYPNEKKRAAGRVPALAKIISSQTSVRTVEDLGQAFAGPSKPCSFDSGRISVGSSLYRLLTGPPGLDRSRDTYAAANELVRSGYDEIAIMGFLLNQDLTISGHCLGQADPQRAARRAIEKARQELQQGVERFSDGAIRATPYPWPDPRSIPKRRWLYGKQLLRGTLAVIVAPGGMGKTALTVGMALSMSTGIALLGKEIPDGSLNVWLWNLEDSRDELNRAIAGASLHHKIDPTEVAGKLYVDSGLDGTGLCIAVQTREGYAICEPVYDGLFAEITARKVDVLIVDPFVSSHHVPENDNGAIDAVAKTWARLAAATNCAIVLVHHTSKSGGIEITAERARGAGALVNAARSVVALNRMDAQEAQRLGVREEDRRRYFRAYDDKNNRAPPAQSSDWYQLESVMLPNGGEDDCFGDSVGVVASWKPPTAQSEELELHRIAELQSLIADGEWRESDRAAQWAGKAVAQAFELDCDERADKLRIKAILKQCIKKGWILPEQRRDRHREMRTWIVIGNVVPERDPEQPVFDSEDAAVPQLCRSSAAAEVPQLPCRSAPPLGGTAAAARQSVS